MPPERFVRAGLNAACVVEALLKRGGIGVHNVWGADTVCKDDAWERAGSKIRAVNQSGCVFSGFFTWHLY